MVTLCLVKTTQFDGDKLHGIFEQTRALKYEFYIFASLLWIQKVLSLDIIIQYNTRTDKYFQGITQVK